MSMRVGFACAKSFAGVPAAAAPTPNAAMPPAVKLRRLRIGPGTGAVSMDGRAAAPVPQHMQVAKNPVEWPLRMNASPTGAVMAACPAGKPRTNGETVQFASGRSTRSGFGVANRLAAVEPTQAAGLPCDVGDAPI